MSKGFKKHSSPKHLFNREMEHMTGLRIDALEPKIERKAIGRKP